jgi:H+/Cl- antiporter ClcA
VPAALLTRRYAVADAAAIVLFATIGQLSHHGHVSLGGYAEDALPLLAAWFAASAVFGGRFVPTWFVGVSAGVLLRAALLGHWYAKELAFWAVALVFVGFFAATTRATWRTVLRRRTARSAPG